MTPLMIPLNLALLLPTPHAIHQFPLTFDTLAVFLVWVLAVAEFAGLVVVHTDAADPGARGGAAFPRAGRGGHVVNEEIW
ncbi:hypothetical protein Vi05172_g7121 [Venturia inaequalis]|nr:hypothetical protein Vi05172_g7121 [Venturia inaequalis]